jgi:hypothetical protein
VAIFATKLSDEHETAQKLCSTTTRPDFLLNVPGVGSVLVEVESFVEKLEGFPPKSGFSQVNMTVPRRRMSNAIRHASKQLKPYESLKIPMVVLLDNHRLCGIPSNIEDLRDACFGEIQFRAPFDPVRGQLGEFFIHHHGHTRTLTETHKRYVSAVLWNMPKIDFAYDDSRKEVPMRVAGILNHNALVPLPPTVFSDPEDRIWGYNSSGRWQKFHEAGSR